MPLATAGAATTLDVTVEALSQFVFTLLGIAVLAAIGTDRAWRPWLGGGVLLMGACVVGFALAQRAGLFVLLERLAMRLGTSFPALRTGDMRGMHAELMRLQKHRLAVLRGAGWHLLGWLLGISETWLALAAIGRPTGFAEALVIESLGMAARSAGFAVPGALGVQEGGFLLVGSLFGVPPEAAVALSVLKRAREILAGLPGLLAWQWAEGARWAARRGR
jgi:putative membrane protein